MKVKFLKMTRCNGHFVNVGDVETVEDGKAVRMIKNKIAVEVEKKKASKIQEKANVSVDTVNTGPNEESSSDDDFEFGDEVEETENK